MTMDPEQRAALARAKLRSLVRDMGSGGSGEGEPSGEPTEVGALTAVVDDGRAAVLLPDGAPAALAAAVLWASRQDATELTVFVDDHGGDVARWASYLHLGGRQIMVRTVKGASSAPTEPSMVPASPQPPSLPDELLQQLRSEDLEIVVEHGQARGEVLGLEVARLVQWPREVGGDGELHLEAGVGRFDRDAVAAVRPDDAPTVSLARTVTEVRRHRYPGAPVHPVQMLARERWLRSTVVADPSLVGAAQLAPADMTSEPGGIKEAHPAAAIGADVDGTPVLVVCSTGVDLSLVPRAADTRELHDSSARLVLALPPQDLHPATTTLVNLLRRPAEVVAVTPGWG